jgi:hypothetical protein
VRKPAYEPPFGAVLYLILNSNVFERSNMGNASLTPCILERSCVINNM